MDNTIIMCKDTEVMGYNMKKNYFEVYSEKHLPWIMKGVVKSIDAHDTKLLLNEAINIITGNRDAIMLWLSTRVLTLQQRYAKDVYNALDIDQLDTIQNKAKFALMFRAVSLLDKYWVKTTSNSALKWKDVDIRNNHLNQVITQISLCGKSISIAGNLIVPELSTLGSFAKGWERKEDGKLYLHKAGGASGTESDIEVMVSNLLDKTNVPHVRYKKDSLYDVETCSCACMTGEDTAIVSAIEYAQYCTNNEMSFFDEALKIDADTIHKMWVVDYITANKDRHSLNWGFYYNPVTMEIQGCHPLFDHNLAFTQEYMGNPDAMYKYDNKMTMREAGKLGASKTDIIFSENVTKSDFLNAQQYNCFMQRCQELKIN